MKKVLGLSVLVLLFLALISAFFVYGDEGVTITIENATNGKLYSGYKIFDATYADGDLAAYTIKSSSYWYPFIDDDLFIVDEVGGTLGTLYNVIRKEGVTDEEIIAWIKVLTPPASPDLAKTEATNSLVTWTDVEDGYYYITSSLGSLVTVLNGQEDIEILDKNQRPGWEYPTEPEGEGLPEKPPTLGAPQAGKNVSKDGVWYGETCTGQIGDTVYFKINIYAPKYNLGERIFKYQLRDYIDEGYTYNQDMQIFINGDLVLPARGNTTEWPKDGGIMISIEIPVYEYWDIYPTDTHIEIKYSAVVNSQAFHENNSLIELDWDELEPSYIGGIPLLLKGSVDTPPPSEAKTYTYGFVLEKVDQNGDTVLGATFCLYDSVGNRLQLKEEDNGYRVLGGAEELFDDYIEIRESADKPVIFGIDIDTAYFLEEIKAPPGYNRLTGPVMVYYDLAAEYDGGGIFDDSIIVVNLAGSKLPDTGSIGTKIFLATGSFIMLAAAIVFVVKKRKVDML